MRVRQRGRIVVTSFLHHHMIVSSRTAKRLFWSVLAISSVLVTVLQQPQSDDETPRKQQQQLQQYEFRLLFPPTGSLRGRSAPGDTTTALPRVVFLMEPWNTMDINSRRISLASHSSQIQLSLYPLRINRTLSTVKTIPARLHDATRYYVHEDSKDLRGMEQRQWPNHAFRESCVPMHDWQSLQFPVCNSVHEMDWRQKTTEDKLSLLKGNGFWRNAWKYSEEIDQEGHHLRYMNPSNQTNSSTTTVWKTFKLEHDMEEAFFENSRVDALAMERLTSSPYVIRMYAFCGMTVATEFAGKETAEVVNKLNSTERLELAVKITKGLSDIHSIGGGEDKDDDDPSPPASLVLRGGMKDGGISTNDGNRAVVQRPSVAHNDINLANLVFTDEDSNRPLWNDFNIAILLMKDKDTGETCPFQSHFPNPQWRAPEEQVYSEDESDQRPPIVTEKVDIYGLGNVLYRLAAGLSPWKKPGAKNLSIEEKMNVARMKRINGTMPTVPEDVLQNKSKTDPAIAILLQAMYRAYEYDPRKRPTATSLFHFLKNGYDQIIISNSLN